MNIQYIFFGGLEHRSSLFKSIMFSNNSHSFILKQMRPKRKGNFLTVFILGCIILIFLFAYIAYGSEKTTDESLIQLNVLFRHGERTPSFTFPNDPYKDYEWPDGLGSLTNEGKLSMFQLGENLKKRYGRFLGDLYFPSEVSVLSSYSPRCQMSAMTFFAGLYPPAGSQKWNEDLNWQPILVNPIPRSSDNLIVSRVPCKAFDVEKKKSDSELHYKLFGHKNDLFLTLSKHTGMNISNIEDIEYLYSTLKIEEDNGLKLPDWTQEFYPEPMKTYAAQNFASYTRTKTLKRLGKGPLVKEWLSNLQTGKKKAYFYSGHDMTLVGFMRTLSLVGDDFLPDFGATLVFELHKVENEKMIKAFYYNSSKNSEPMRLDLPNCSGDFCPLKLLVKTLRPFVPDNWEKECNFLEK